MTQSVSNDLWSSSRFRIVGYSLLVLALLDFIHILVPPQFMDPMWEFQTIGKLVERVPVPLLGLMLVFYGDAQLRRKREIKLLKFLSWASLIIGVLFLLLIPLLVLDSSRLNNQINDQINSQLNQQVSGLQQLQTKVSQGTDKDLNDVVARLTGNSQIAVKNTQEVKSKLLSNITKTKSTVESQVKAAAAQQRLALLKSSAKWLLGAMVSGVLFIYMAFHGEAKITF